MKKTLIALAALAATGAFAQSTVTIEGTLDIGVKGSSAPITATNQNSSFGVAAGNIATPSLRFRGAEDLGGGMKANFMLEVNPNLVSSTMNNQATSSGNSAALDSGAPFNGEQYLGLSGSFGEVKLGVPNAGMFDAALAATPLGTGMGSGYASTFARFGGTANYGIVSAFGNSSGNRIIRHEKSIQYVSPSFSGLTVKVDYAQANDNSTTATSNTDGYKGLTFAYANGPLNVVYSYANDSIGTNGIGVPGALFTPATSAAALNGTDISYNFLSANYAFGAATVYAGYSTAKHNPLAGANALIDTNAYNLHVKYALNATVDLIGGYMQRNSNVATENNARMYVAGADYKMSKRSSLYARYEYQDANSDGKVGTAGGSVTSAVAFGIKHTF